MYINADIDFGKSASRANLSSTQHLQYMYSTSIYPFLFGQVYVVKKRAGCNENKINLS